MKKTLILLLTFGVLGTMLLESIGNAAPKRTVPRGPYTCEEDCCNTQPTTRRNNPNTGLWCETVTQDCIAAERCVIITCPDPNRPCVQTPAPESAAPPRDIHQWCAEQICIYQS